MTQKQLLLDLFQRNGLKLTLGQILQHPFGYEARARFTELRREGFTILYQRGKTPSDNLYPLIPPDGWQRRFA